MFKSKHSGWTWDLKRTPFGGGGGDIFQSVGNALASIDPGPSIGNALASVDKTVNNAVPGGWITVGGLAAGGLALAYAPEVMAFAEANGITPAAASTELGIAPVNAATGEVVAPDVFAGLSANAPVDTSLSQTAAASMAGSAGAGSADIGLGTNAALQGPTYQELGYTGLPQGAAGPTYGELGYTGLNQNEAIDAASKGMSASDVLSNANRAKNLANMLNQSATSGLSTSLGKLAQGAHPYGAEQLQVVRGNQSPFSYVPQTPIQDKKPDLSALAELLKQG